MRLDLSVQEAELLDALLDAVVRDRQREIHHTDSREYRKRLERETELIDSLRAKLAHRSEAA
jgi:hypothetical protein